MAHPLMPRATAIWLVDNTTLSFVQIAEFCGLHELEVQAIADGEVAQSMVGVDPIQAGQLTREELERCSKDSTTRLTLVETSYGHKIASLKKERYTPRARRQDRPDAIAWILKHCPNLTDPQVVR
ncbi:MAG: DUF1013 domain-containing protein, partial [Alphaproteobacteria bacterium]|nr:DUF1013 domain-containing protein [Alphaproteobacteria bacterium]